MLEVVTTGVGTRQHSRVALADLRFDHAPQPLGTRRRAQSHRRRSALRNAPLRGQGFIRFALPLPRACHLSVTASGIAGLVIGTMCAIPPRLSRVCPLAGHTTMAAPFSLSARRRNNVSCSNSTSSPTRTRLPRRYPSRGIYRPPQVAIDVVDCERRGLRPTAKECLFEAPAAARV